MSMSFEQRLWQEQQQHHQDPSLPPFAENLFALTSVTQLPSPSYDGHAYQAHTCVLGQQLEARAQKLFQELQDLQRQVAQLKSEFPNHPIVQQQTNSLSPSSQISSSSTPSTSFDPQTSPASSATLHFLDTTLEASLEPQKVFIPGVNNSAGHNIIHILHTCQLQFPSNTNFQAISHSAQRIKQNQRLCVNVGLDLVIPRQHLYLIKGEAEAGDFEACVSAHDGFGTSPSNQSLVTVKDLCKVGETIALSLSNPILNSPAPQSSVPPFPPSLTPTNDSMVAIQFVGSCNLLFPALSRSLPNKAVFIRLCLTPQTLAILARCVPPWAQMPLTCPIRFVKVMSPNSTSKKDCAQLKLDDSLSGLKSIAKSRAQRLAAEGYVHMCDLVRFPLPGDEPSGKQRFEETMARVTSSRGLSQSTMIHYVKLARRLKTQTTSTGSNDLLHVQQQQQQQQQQAQQNFVSKADFCFGGDLESDTSGGDQDDESRSPVFTEFL